MCTVVRFCVCQPGRLAGRKMGPVFGLIFGSAQSARGLPHIRVFEGSFKYHGYFGTPMLGQRGPNLRPENGTSFSPPEEHTIVEISAPQIMPADDHGVAVVEPCAFADRRWEGAAKDQS